MLSLQPMSELIKNNAYFILTHSFNTLTHFFTLYLGLKMKCHSTPGASGKAVLLSEGQRAKRESGFHDPLQDHTQCPKNVLSGCTSEIHYHSQYCHCENHAFDLRTIGRDTEIKTWGAERRTSLMICQIKKEHYWCYARPLASEFYCVWGSYLDTYPEI